VLCALGDADQAARAIAQAEASLIRLGRDYEILVTGAENTALAFSSEASPDPHVRYPSCPGPDGYAAALSTARAVSRHPLIAVTNGTVDLSALDYLVPLAERYGVVCGYRVDRSEGVCRRCLALGYNGLARLFLGTRVRDCGSGPAVSVFQRAALAEILPESQGFFASAEIFARARRRGLTVAEAPVCCVGRPAGKLRVGWRDIRRILRDGLLFWWSGVQFPGQQPAARAPQTSWLLGLMLMLVASLVLFPKLNQPLLDPDEGRQVEIPREMLAHKDMLLPRVDGGPYYEKPPLQYWLTAGAYRVFGVSSRSARLVPASAAWLAVLLTYLWGRRALGNRGAFLGALGLCLTPGFVVLGRTVVLDSLLATCVLAAWFAAEAAVRRSPWRWRWWLVSALCCGLGILAKGPVALVLLVPPVGVYQYLTPTAARPCWRHWAVYVSVALGLAAPWYVSMAWREPDYVGQFLWRANVLRYVAAFDHEEPWWFYAPILFALTFPWSLLWPALGYFLASRDNRLAVLRNPALGFCACAMGWCLLFYSLSGCKSPPYLAPCLPTLALLLGTCVDAVLFRRIGQQNRYLSQVRQALPRWAAAGVLAVAAVCYLGVAVLGWQDYRLALCKLALVAAAAVLWLRYGMRLRPMAAWGACALATLALVTFIGRDLGRAYASRRTPALMARLIPRGLRTRGCPVVMYGRHWASASFYFRREMVQYFDVPQRPALVEFLLQQPQALVLVESGPLLDGLLGALPAALQLEVHRPERAGQVALVAVRQQQKPAVALGPAPARERRRQGDNETGRQATSPGTIVGGT
jgi:dolichol-phosphate mannosyltransferase